MILDKKTNFDILCGEDNTVIYLQDESDLDGNVMEMPRLLDPKLLRMARRIYRSYCMLHPKSVRQPYGIAIHKETHRGQLMFNQQPILLPGECFVSMKQLDIELQQARVG